jgi:8-oxo-dGTP pyrophosphatase MutT (NUDIX family)
MAVWRPSDTISVKVIGIARRGGSFLAADVEEDDGRVKGVRPLGGSAEFGETREEALRREFAEELWCSIIIREPWRAFENIHAHEGRVGHEYIFAADIELLDESLYSKDEILFPESNGSIWRARWVDCEEVKAGRLAVFPAGLEALLFGPDETRQRRRPAACAAQIERRRDSVRSTRQGRRALQMD